MFPTFTSRSSDFTVLYCLMSHEFAETAFYGVPSAFFDGIFLCPIVAGGNEMDTWFRTLLHVVRDDASYQCQGKICENVVRSIFLVFFNLWQQYGSKQIPQLSCHHREAGV